MKILIVDDSPTISLIINQQVKSLGHKTIIATNGNEGIIKFREESPDLVLMDVMMPGVDGYETTRQIRSICNNIGWVPIIFLTGKSDDESLAEGIEAGGDDYITKPVSELVLISKIRAMERIASMRKQLMKANEELERLSIIDGLTGISNRRRFDEIFQTEWQRSMREKQPLAIIMMDIDFFKFYNDNYGHLGGDNCLIKVAEGLKNTLNRATDMVARYGGEEFIALLPNTTLENAEIVAESFRKKIEELNITHEFSKAAKNVTISLGVSSTIAQKETDPLKFLEKADETLYQAKENGRNQYKSLIF